VTHGRLTPLLVFALAGCHHSPPALTAVGPEQHCDGQLVLEFTNRLAVPVQVGWIPSEQLRADPTGGAPIWLGVLGMESIRYEVPGPGRVIFRTANPAAASEDRHSVRHRLLCRAS